MVEFQPVCPQQFLNGGAVKVAEVENPHLTAQVGHIGDDITGLGLSNGEFVLGHIKALHQFHKGFHGEGVIRLY